MFLMATQLDIECMMTCNSEHFQIFSVVQLSFSFCYQFWSRFLVSKDPNFATNQLGLYIKFSSFCPVWKASAILCRRRITWIIGANDLALSL
jgi:hypothetical protein